MNGRRLSILALLGSLAAPIPAAAQTGLLVPTSTGHPDEAVLALREMKVEAGISRGYARVNVVQVFENRTGEIQEGTWRFQLPPSGAVGDFAVWDGAVRIPGVILEKKRARAIYRDLTTQRIDPGLLQQGEEDDRPAGGGGPRPSGGAAFSVKVAPIPAWGTKRLELQYQHEVPWVDGTAEFRFPLKPGEGTGMTAGALDVRVVVEEGEPLPPSSGFLPLVRSGRESSFHGTAVRLSEDVVLRFRPSVSTPLAFTAFRNPQGSLPEGLALAPWERPSEIPPEKDGFFLLEYRPSALAGQTAKATRPAVHAVFLFDTSLAHRWNGLEAAWGLLVRLLDLLGPDDSFAVVPFDRVPAEGAPPLARALPDSKARALEFLRSRPLEPGSAPAKAVREAASRLAQAPPGSGRIVLLTGSAAPSAALNEARKGLPLFSVLTGEERAEGLTAVSEASLHPASSGEAEETLFLRRVFSPIAPARTGKVTDDSPLKAGAGPELRDVYPVMTQPPAPGSLSGWVGRYGKPAQGVSLAPKVEGAPSLAASFPETALEARDLPRRWARARVDYLLAKIELEGEKRAWVEEIIALSRRYKFVTPYTAFLAAPRSLLRPRRIQPGDPVIRIEASPEIVAAVALLPFGKSVDLSRRPGTNLWEGRFLVPDGTLDGPLPVRLILRDISGAKVSETKTVVIDGTPPVIRPDLPVVAAAGETVTVAARADADVVFLSVRLDGGPPIPLRWDPKSLRSTARLALPPGSAGHRELFFEASDAAGNHGFARAGLEVSR
jgi:Ca-activated chloride channel family protein